MTQTLVNVNTKGMNIAMDVEGDIRVKVEPIDAEEKKTLI